MPNSWPPVAAPTQAARTPSYLTQPPEVIPIDTGRQLFVDDFLIASTTLVRTPHRPVMYAGNPVLKPSGNGDTAMPFSDGVWYDPADKLFKMWYFGPNAGPYLSYAYSKDGKTWIKPALPNAAAPNTNIVIHFGGGRDSGTVWMDLEDPDPSRKFKGFFYGGGGKLRVFFSPDGIRWTEQPFTIRTTSDRTTLFRNPFRNKWVQSARSSATLPATGLRPARLSRSRYYFESSDLLNWQPVSPDYSFWTSTDELDPAYPGTETLPQLYNLDVVAYESLFVGLFSMYYPEPAPLLVELNAGFSRDGYQWSRHTRGGGANAFIPATNRDGDWNGFNTQSTGGGFLVVGDELWFYFSGRSGRHGAPYSAHEMSTGLAVLRRDGFSSMDAREKEGTLTTRPVRFSGKELFVNVNNPGGALQVEILDEQGLPIYPYVRENSAVVAVNSTKHRMTWAGVTDLSALAGRNVRFRFYLRQGELYAFWVSADKSGASNGYVAAGGPGFTSARDTTGGGTVAQDKQSPTAPANVQATVVSSNQVNLSWSPSTDNEGIAGYRVFRNGSLAGSPAANSWTDSGLSAGTSYEYFVVAVDTSGNVSDKSVAVRITTPSAQVLSPPVITPPGGSFTGSVRVTIAGQTGTELRYTLDGSEPGPASQTYSEPLVLTTTAVLKVKAFRAGSAPSASSTAAFTVLPSNTGSVVTMGWEAESSAIARPMQSLYLGPALVSGGYFVRNTVEGSGELTYSVTVPKTGSYVLWGRVSSSSKGASFHVSVDGGAETLWSCQEARSGTWQWCPADPGGAGSPLAPGVHILRIRGAKSYSYLDRLLLTDDKSLIPSGLTGN